MRNRVQRRGAVALVAATLFWAAPCAAQSAMDQLQSIIAQMPQDLFDLSDLDVTTVGTDVTASATTTLLGARTDVLFSFSMAKGSRGYLVGFHPDDWSLGKALSSLKIDALNGISLSNVVLVISSDSVSRSSAEMTPGERAFYASLLDEDDFTLELRPGINLIASIPVEKLPPDHPLLKVMDALGIERGTVRLQGTLGKSLALLTQPSAGGLSALKDLYLRAELPPMHPKGSPDWFRYGQLALEITGDPSLRLVGEMGVRVQQDQLAFFLAMSLAKSGLTLAGGLQSDQGWQQPFGVQWLTLYKVVLTLGITSTGSVQLGFGGNLVVGEKDMTVAMSLAISPAGVPTSFMIDGQSEAGFGLSDLAALQEKMAAARQAAQSATGVSGPVSAARIPLDALPPVDFRDVGLKFAPKDEPELDVKKGMAIKGQMYLPAGANGTMEDFAGVDVSVDADGIIAKANIAASQIGPLTWQDAVLDLTATREEQHLRLNGDVSLLGNRQKIDLLLTRQQMQFHTITELYGLFHAAVDATAAFNLRQPKFQVHAVARNDLGGALQPFVRDGATIFANSSGIVIATADTAIADIRSTLNVADATVQQLRDALERQRAAARATVDSMQSIANSFARLVRSRRAARDRAHDLWSSTSRFRVGLRASRYAAFVRAGAAYRVAAGRYAARLAIVASARRVLNALPPVDQNVLLMAAADAARAIRQHLEQAEQRLEALRQQHDALVAAISQGGTLIQLTRGEVNADLDRLSSGQALEWHLTGVFVNKPFDVTATLDFSEPAAAAGQLLSGLLQS